MAATPGQVPSQTPNEAAAAGGFPPPLPGQFPEQAAYGYPHPQGGYPSQGGYPTQAGYGYPHPQSQYQAPVNVMPDWETLANQEEERARRRRRMITAGVAAAAVLLGVGAGFAVINKTGGKADPVASGSPSATGKPSGKASGSGSAAPNSEATVPGDPNSLADASGQADLAIGPDAQVSKVQNGSVLRLRSNNNSHAQAAGKVVDVAGSFTIAAWVYNEAQEGPRTAVSQGDGTSYSFDLGRDVAANGKKSWVFRVQTVDGGADASVVQVTSENLNTVGEWALLTGTYDAGSKTIALYVNGQPASTTATAKVPGIWAGPGPFQLGRSRQHKLWAGHWAGVLGSIKIWNQALTPEQVATLKTNGVKEKPVASWLVG